MHFDILPMTHRFRSLLAAALLLGPSAATLRADGPPTLKDVTPAGLADSKTKLVGIDYGNGVFVANAQYFDLSTGTGHSVTFTSQDGANWAQTALDFSAGGKVRFAGGKFYLFGADPNRHIYSSTDGVTWAVVDDATEENAAGDLATDASGNIRVAARATGLSGPAPSVSTDGVNWTSVPLPGAPSLSNFIGVAFGAGKFAVVGQALSAPYLYTSADGRAWTAQAGLSNYGGFDFIAYGNGTFLVQERSYPAQQLVSTDAVTWTPANPGLRQTISGMNIGRALGYTRFLNGQFVAVGNGTDIVASTDAQNWTTLALLPAGADASKDVAFGADAYVVGSDNHIYTSAAATGPVPKQAELTVKFKKVRVVANASKTKFKGKLSVNNSGKRNASSVQVAAFLSADATFSDDDVPVSTINLADYGFGKLHKNSKAGFRTAFHARTDAVGATSGKYLLIVVDPSNAIEESDETNNVFAYGPLP